MDVGEAMSIAGIIAGVGCRRGVSAEEVEAAVRAALARLGLASAALEKIAAPAAKAGEGGIAAAAATLGVPLFWVAPDDLTLAGGRVATHSARVSALMGVPCIAEAAALAAAGPKARLLLPRIAVGPATCALADGGGMQ
jgi:cobalt-precorrin 5A hydrolase